MQQGQTQLSLFLGAGLIQILFQFFFLQAVVVKFELMVAK